MKHNRFPVFIKSRYIRSIFPLFILIFIFFNTELKNIKSIEDSIVQAAYGSRGIMYQQQYIFNVLLPGDYKETQYEFDIDNFKNVRDFRKLLTKAKSANPDINLKRNTQSLKLKEKVDHISVEDFI